MSDLVPLGPAMKLIFWCLHSVSRFHPRFRSHRLLYQVLASPFSEGLDEFEFLNYGYVPLGDGTESLKLEDEEEIYRTNIQLYHHVASAVSLQGQDVLEVGCGHGGGAAYVMRSLRPRRMEAVDLSERSVRLCCKRYPLEGLTFRVGNAMALPYENEQFDAVLNIESSHAYPSTETFFQEVERVLRPRGHLLFADLRHKKKIPQVWRDVESSGMKITRHEYITDNVLKARDEFTRHMAEEMRARMKWFGSFALSWLGARDSLVYGHLQNRRFEYLFCVIQKPG